MDPIVLVENEMTAGGRYDFWEDVTGERYQFPNIYKNRIRSGRRFVYYRGVRRAGGKRGQSEYFGHGVIGDVELDPGTQTGAPKRQIKWIASIVDYSQFKVPVPARVNGKYIEEIAKNLWGVPRDLSEAAYAEILNRAGQHPVPDICHTALTLDLPDLSLVRPALVQQSLLTVTLPASSNHSKSSGSAPRRSRYSVVIGRRGEEAVLKYLSTVLGPRERKSLRWVSAEGATPGWDIEFKSEERMVRIEVKASSGPMLPTIELTANEWSAARKHRQEYLLALVANVRTARPQISFICDPFQQVESQALVAEPSGWVLRRVRADG